MADVDPELLKRTARWCAEAGRQAGVDEIRRALASLSWDELLAARALLADPPPARPLGPFALADLARGAPPDLAAEREREGRYGSQAAEPAPAAPPEPEPPAPSRPRRSTRRAAKGRGVVIRRARDVIPTPAAAPRPAPPVDELLRPEGRTVLERLVRTHGARRPALVAALAAGWRRDGGAAPGDEDLSRLLDHHGLTRAFERRERDDILHALRAAGGARAAAASRLGLEPAGLDAALARLGASTDAERVREQRRADLRTRATLSERVRLVLVDEPRLRDLGVLAEFEQDLRARLPEHVRALRVLREPLAAALGRSLSVTTAEARTLALRFGLDLGTRAAPPVRPRPNGPGDAPRTAPGTRPARGDRPDRAAGKPPRTSPAGARPDRRGDRPGPPAGKPPRTSPAGTRPDRRGDRLERAAGKPTRTAQAGARPDRRGDRSGRPAEKAPRTAPAGARPDRRRPGGRGPAPRGRR
jgi:Bacterial regulatory protein, Fis family